MGRLALTGLLVVSSIVIAADKPKEKPLSAAEKKAVAKYDDLPDEWREKAIAAWKAEFKNQKANKARLMKNDPPFYPDLIEEQHYGKETKASLRADAWGKMGRRSADDKKTEQARVIVFQVINKKRAIIKHGNLMYFLDGLDTSNMADGSSTPTPGLFYVDGNDTYDTVGGSTSTLRIVKPVPKK